MVYQFAITASISATLLAVTEHNDGFYRLRVSVDGLEAKNTLNQSCLFKLHGDLGLVTNYSADYSKFDLLFYHDKALTGLKPAFQGKTNSVIQLETIMLDPLSADNQVIPEVLIIPQPCFIAAQAFAMKMSSNQNWQKTLFLFVIDADVMPIKLVPSLTIINGLAPEVTGSFETLERLGVTARVISQQGIIGTYYGGVAEFLRAHLFFADQKIYNMSLDVKDSLIITMEKYHDCR